LSPRDFDGFLKARFGGRQIAQADEQISSNEM